MALQINEASTCLVTARFYDSGNARITPNSVRYLIRDLTNNRLVKDWTTVTPAQEVEIEIAASDNEVYENARTQAKYEKRVVTVQANADETTQTTEEIEYWIKNLYGLVD